MRYIRCRKHNAVVLVRLNFALTGQRTLPRLVQTQAVPIVCVDAVRCMRLMLAAM